LVPVSNIIISPLSVCLFLLKSVQVFPVSDCIFLFDHASALLYVIAGYFTRGAQNSPYVKSREKPKSLPQPLPVKPNSRRCGIPHKFSTEPIEIIFCSLPKH